MPDLQSSLSPWDPNGSLSNADADRIWASYKAAGGGRDVSGSLPQGGGLPSGDGGRFTGARGMFGSMAGGGGGGLLAMLQQKFGGGAAPAVPADGSMPATIGPGMPAAAPAAAPAAYKPKLGMPSGGLLGMMQGGSPQGLMGLLQHLSKPGVAPGAPLAGAMPQAGMLPGMPGSPMAGPMAPTPQLPTDINPMNQF